MENKKYYGAKEHEGDLESDLDLLLEIWLDDIYCIDKEEYNKIISDKDYTIDWIWEWEKEVITDSYIERLSNRLMELLYEYLDEDFGRDDGEVDDGDYNKESIQFIKQGIAAACKSYSVWRCKPKW